LEGIPGFLPYFEPTFWFFINFVLPLLVVLVELPVDECVHHDFLSAGFARFVIVGLFFEFGYFLKAFEIKEVIFSQGVFFRLTDRTKFVLDEFYHFRFVEQVWGIASIHGI
jgi:hypothetical protein